MALLDLLPAAERDRLLSAAERVHLEQGAVLEWPNQPAVHVYFPVDCVASVLLLLDDGAAVETGLVGCDGVVGLHLFLGAATTPNRVEVQVPGEAWRLPAAALLAAAGW